MGARVGNGGARDRSATEAALEEAALRLLERDGVLAGLNLQEVAGEAGVNRGLVYHYFGSRRELLRRALRRRVGPHLDQIDLWDKMALADRMRALFRAMVEFPRIPKLVLLLAIDGDKEFQMPGDISVARAALERDVAAGDLAGDVDFDAFVVAVMSIAFTYSVRRRSFAKELRVPVRDLDARVEAVLLRMVEGLKPRP